jgi:hypothetical protein
LLAKGEENFGAGSVGHGLVLSVIGWVGVIGE